MADFKAKFAQKETKCENAIFFMSCFTNNYVCKFGRRKYCTMKGNLICHENALCMLFMLLLTGAQVKQAENTSGASPSARKSLISVS